MAIIYKGKTIAATDVKLIEGTAVEANPVDPATEPLSKLKVGTTTYGVSGSGAYVDLTTDQEIGGEKTFTDKVKSNDIETVDGKNIARYVPTGATSMEVGNSSSYLRLFSSGRPTVSKNGVVQGSIAYTSDIPDTGIQRICQFNDDVPVHIDIELNTSCSSWYSVYLSQARSNHFIVDGTTIAFPTTVNGEPCKVEIYVYAWEHVYVVITGMSTGHVAPLQFTAHTSCELVNEDDDQGVYSIVGICQINDY